MKTSPPNAGNPKHRYRRQERHARATLGQIYAQMEEKQRLQHSLGKRRRHLVRVIQRLEPASKEDRATAMKRLVLLNKKEANRKERHQAAVERRRMARVLPRFVTALSAVAQKATEVAAALKPAQ